MNHTRFSLAICVLMVIISGPKASASHILAGGFTYTYIDSVGPGYYSGHYIATPSYHYKIRLTLYQDCRTGQPEAIAQDNPAFFTIYNNSSTSPYIVDTTVYFDTASSVVVPVDYTTPCGTFSTPATDFCALKKVFEQDYYLPPSSTGYTVAYQRCCRSASIANIVDPGDKGTTYFCKIPPVPLKNTSAVFTKNPPMVVCKDNTLVYDLSAYDADGDSLSYELSECYEGASDNAIKPVIAPPPPYDSIDFVPLTSYSNPLGAAPLVYNPVSGWMTMTPDHLGVFLIGISCHEWRGGVLINTTTMEFNCLVVNCASGYYAVFHPNAGNDTVIYTGDTLHFNVTNCPGCVSYAWSPADYLSNAHIANPTGVFPVSGIVTYVVAVVNDSGCSGADTVYINVLDHACFAVPNGFTPNGDNKNDVLIPYSLKNAKLKTFRVFNREGRMMYSGSLPNEGWDGRCNGKEAGLGVYTWQIEYEDNFGVSRMQTGNTTLLR